MIRRTGCDGVDIAALIYYIESMTAGAVFHGGKERNVQNMDNNTCQYDGSRFNQWGVCEKCGNTKEKQEEARKRAEKPNRYCPHCGTQFNDNGVCPKCGAKQNGVIMAKAAEDTVRSAWDYIKAVFSSNPMAAVENAGREKTHIWAALGFLAWIFGTLGLFCVGSASGLGGVGNVAQDIAMVFTGGIKSTAKNDKFQALDSMAGSGVKLFFYTLGFVLVFTFVVFFLRKLMFAAGKKNVTLVGAMNIAAVSLIPFIAASILAIPVSFLSPVVSMLLMFIGIIAGYIQTYFGMQRAASYENSPFWAFIGVIAGDIAAFSLVSLLFYGLFC